MNNKISGLIFIMILILFPFILRGNYPIHILTMSCIFAVLVLSWDILSGYGGLFSFGHPIFFGFGAYVSALLAIRLDFSPWPGLLMGGLSAGLLGFLIGLPVLRLRGSYVAIVTLSFMIITYQICTNWTSLTNGPTGLSGIPPLSNIEILGIFINFDAVNRIPYYYTAALILALSAFIQIKFVNSTTGIHLVAIREDEEAASAIGVNPTRCKLIAFVLSSFLAGIAGGFYAHFIKLLSPGLFSFDVMLAIMTMNLLGGAGTTYGPIAGAFILTFLSEYLRDFGPFRFILYGLFIIFAISFMPRGILKDLLEKIPIQNIFLRPGQKFPAKKKNK